MTLQLLTATGARPAAWALCERWMRAQDYRGPVRWIVVDDGPEPQPVTFMRPGWTVEVIRPEPFWEPGQNTQTRNLLAGLAVVDDGAGLVIVEDDDWYAPAWLSVAEQKLRQAELIGEVCSRYFNVATRIGRQLTNRNHASLCCTAVRGAAIDALRDSCRAGVKFVDLRLWREFRGRKRLFGTHHVVGIKGLPGRTGIGVGHRETFTGVADRSGRLLRAWIGEDARVYL